jgi:uncharacterized protein YoxC
MNGLEVGIVIVSSIVVLLFLALLVALIRLADSIRRAVPEFENAARNINTTVVESKKIIKDLETAVQSSQKILENSVQITLKTDRFLENALPRANMLMEDIQSKSNRLETSVSEIARISERISQINDNIDKFVLPIIDNFSGLADRFQEYIQKYSEKKKKKEKNEYEMDYHIERKVEDE